MPLPECMRETDKTPRKDYPLPDFLSAGLISDLSGLALPGDLRLESLLFLDTETTGLSGGAGTMEHFHEALTDGGADAALAASLFHYKELEITALKEYLRNRGITVRL